MSSQFKPWMVMVTSFVTALVFMLAFTRPSLGVWSPPHTGLSLVRRANFTVSALLLATSGQNYTQLKSPAAEELQRFFDNALLVKRESIISVELERLSFHDATEREKFLIRLLASAAIVRQFEQTYSLIWGSQIGALQFLNSL